MPKLIANSTGALPVVKKTVLVICLIVLVSWAVVAIVISTSFDYDIWNGTNKPFNVFTIIAGICTAVAYAMYRLLPGIKYKVRTALKRIPQGWHSIIDSGMTPYFNPEYNIIKKGRYVKAMDQSIEADQYGLPIVDESMPLSSFNMAIYKRYYSHLFHAIDKIRYETIRQAYDDSVLNNIFQIDAKIRTFFDIFKERTRVHLIGKSCMIVKPFRKPHLLIHKNAYLAFVQDMQRDSEWELETKQFIKDDMYNSSKLSGLRWLLSATVASSEYTKYANQSLYIPIYKELWTMAKLFPDQLDIVYDALYKFVHDTSNSLSYPKLEQATAKLSIRADIVNYEPIITQSIESKLDTNEVVDMYDLYKYLIDPSREMAIPMNHIIGNSVKAVETLFTAPMIAALNDKQRSIEMLKNSMQQYALANEVPYIQIKISKLLKYLQGDVLAVVTKHNRDNSEGVKITKRLSAAMSEMRIPSVSIGHLNVQSTFKAFKKNRHMFDNLLPRDKVVKSKTTNNINDDLQIKAIQHELKQMDRMQELTDSMKQRYKDLKSHFGLLVKRKELKVRITSMQQQLITIFDRRANQTRYGAELAPSKEVVQIQQEIERAESEASELDMEIETSSTPIPTNEIEAGSIQSAQVIKEETDKRMLEFGTFIQNVNELLIQKGKMQDSNYNELSAERASLYKEYMDSQTQLSTLTSQLNSAISVAQHQQRELDELKRKNQVQVLVHDAASSAQLIDLRKKIITKTEEVNKANLTIENVKTEFKKLEDKLAVCTETTVALRQELYNQTQANAVLTKELELKQNELNMNVATTAQQQALIERMNAEVKDARNAFEDSKRDANAFEDSKRDANAYKTKLLFMQSLYQHRSESREKIASELNTVKNDLNEYKSNVEKERNTLIAMLDETEIPFNVSSVAMRLSYVLETFKSAKTETEALKASEVALIEKNAELMAKADVDQQRVIDLQQQLDQLQNEHTLTNDHTRAQYDSQISALRAEVDKYLQRLSILNDQKEDINKRRASITEELNKSYERCAEKEEIIKDLSQQNETLMRQLKEYANDTSRREEVMNLTKQLAVVTAQVEEAAKKELEYKSLQAKLNKYQVETNDLKNKLEDYQATIKELEDHIHMNQTAAIEMAKDHEMELSNLKQGYERRLYNCFQRGTSNPLDVKNLIPNNTATTVSGKSATLVLEKVHYDEMNNLLANLLTGRVPPDSHAEAAILKQLYKDVLSLDKLDRSLPESMNDNIPLKTNMIKVATLMLSVYEYHKNANSTYHSILDCNIPFENGSAIQSVQTFIQLAERFFTNKENGLYTFLNSPVLKGQLPNQPLEALEQMRILGFRYGIPSQTIKQTKVRPHKKHTSPKVKVQHRYDPVPPSKVVPIEQYQEPIEQYQEPTRSQIQRDEVTSDDLDELLEEVGPGTFGNRPITRAPSARYLGINEFGARTNDQVNYELAPTINYDAW